MKKKILKALRLVILQCNFIYASLEEDDDNEFNWKKIIINNKVIKIFYNYQHICCIIKKIK